MNKSDKKDRLAKIIGIIIGIAIVIGISYALFNIILVGKKKNKIVTGTLDLELVEEDASNPSKYTVVELNDAVPMTDEEGLATTPYVFTINNKGNIDAKYTLGLEVASDSEMPAGAIKYAYKRTSSSDYFESVPKLLSDVNTHTSKNLNNENVTLYDIVDSNISVNDSVDYELRVWVDYNAGVSASDKSFTAILRVSGVQKNK